MQVKMSLDELNNALVAIISMEEDEEELLELLFIYCLCNFVFHLIKRGMLLYHIN